MATMAVVTAAASPARPAPASTLYPAEVLRVIDGDTFDARVRVWPGMDITTRVRLRDIDAAEFKAAATRSAGWRSTPMTRCRPCWRKASVTIGRVSFDKYGGRVLADACDAAHRRRRPPRCSMPAWCGAIPAGGAWAGAERGRALEKRDQAPTQRVTTTVRADADAAIEVGHVLVVHAEAAVGDKAADRARRVGAVDGVFAAAQGERRRAHGIARRAAGNHVRQPRIVLPHDRQAATMTA